MKAAAGADKDYDLYRHNSIRPNSGIYLPLRLYQLSTELT